MAWVFIRGIGTGLMHSMTASFMGFGLYKARTDENKHSVIIAIVVLLIAMVYHAVFNILISLDSGFKILGVFLPIISYIVISILLKKDAIKAFFDDDIIKEKSKVIE